MDDTDERRPKRQKRDSSYKAKAFEKFKQVKSGVKNKYEIEEVDNVYETVDEKEYLKTVLDRQADDWVVDDDGSGYYDDGREIFDDDLDSQSIANASSKNKGVKRKKKAVSDNVPKGDLKRMLSKMPIKKKEEEKVSDDAMLSELLGEIVENGDESIKQSSDDSSLKSLLNNKKAEKDYLKTFTPPPRKILIKKKTLERKSLPLISRPIKRILDDDEDEIAKGQNMETIDEVVSETEKIAQTMEIDYKSQKIEDSTQGTAVIEDSTQETAAIEDTKIEIDETENFFNDGLDFSQIDEFESQQNETIDVEAVEDNILASFLDQQDNFQSLDSSINRSINIDSSDIPLVEFENKKVFRFFYWDAYENAFVQPGVVFLFGKTYCEKTKSYASCSIVVKNVQRKLFVLPRPYMLDDSGNQTDQPVTQKDVYEEFNNKVMKALHVTCFKCRFVNKKNCFAPNIPVESDYMEVRYSAKDPQISIFEGKTFSHVFGVNSSYLEIFLLERKLKGPCWLDVQNPIPVTNPITWCKFEIDVEKCNDVTLAKMNKPLPPPPLVIAAVHMRFAPNPKNLTNEIVMISCLVHNSYALDKAAPNPPFQSDFCVFTTPQHVSMPSDIYKTLSNFKRTKVQKMDSEKALLNFFINHFQNIDPDLIVGHDLQGYQFSVLADRLYTNSIKNFSKLGRLKRSSLHQKIERILFTGRLVCDIKISAKESIKSRAYDLNTLCQTVLNFRESQRVDLEPEDVPKMFNNSQNILKLIVLTMNDATYILQMMYNLNTIPLALQITNIAGNIMSRTLCGGRSERNEFLLLHAFNEKDFIVPEKVIKNKGEEKSSNSKRKPTYAGGLVLDPKVGFYDKLILLMDFNSLYPSIIQEYNICFTTLPVDGADLTLPDKTVPIGILPTEIRKLVESRREVKKLLKTVDKKSDLYLQYNIRQMALKLTANSMYGCLGFSNSRFYAKSLAALVTHKGREILTNTRDLVQKMCFEVVYGDTDSIMINTNIIDIDQVNKIGIKIKQEVNKLYQQVELDIDGVFKYLLLLKKKKYAAVTITKTDDGKLRIEKEYKGLDIVRRDWSQIACETGKIILDQILSDLSPDERIANILNYLRKIKTDFETNKIPLSMLVITKQLTKDPKSYNDKNSLPHVQVALRYNKQLGGHFRSGDTVPYVVCNDGSNNSAVQRAYHLDELKNSEKLTIDVRYYLSQQIHPVVSRICEPIEGIDAFQIADCLGLDTSSFKKPIIRTENTAELVAKPEIKFKNVDHFIFECYDCKKKNIVDGPLRQGLMVLDRCSNCDVRPVTYLYYIQNQLSLAINRYIKKYYVNTMICEDPACDNETNRIPSRFVGKYPVCTLCKSGIMYKKYTESDLYFQISYFRHIFDISKVNRRMLTDDLLENGYHVLKETAEKYLNQSGYSVVNLTELFSGFMIRDSQQPNRIIDDFPDIVEDEDEI
ncbi:DNA polymerase alpha catalytic subunit [Coccinella septempunctata]|uniref:DNA polymerase alpha catalytic subunit n=1 Tax=Coccinella septempunctata TaxID=41139 RepID=UPI001D099CD8|nr:DNA polymerase alpha catalytic subunit [Coccinella septempunctata]